MQTLTRFEVYEPMVSTAIATISMGLSVFAKYYMNSNPYSMGFALLSAAPGAFHGSKLYTNWIPKLAWKFPKGEVTRALTNVPNVRLGLEGWQRDSTHSNHFDENLAEKLVVLCKQNDFKSSADFDCAGKGQLSERLNKAGIRAKGYDFSEASVKMFKNLKLATLSSKPIEASELVTSIEVMSKTLPGQEEKFVKNLVDATTPGGMIVASCAIPGQPGPNINCHTNEKIKQIFERNQCTYDEAATWDLRRSVNPMHYWLKNTILAFKKNPLEFDSPVRLGSLDSSI